MGHNKFWEKVPLKKMNRVQWEQLCDRCGKCCVHKFIDDDTEELLYTNVACRLFDPFNCTCKDYKHRVPECMVLTKADIKEFHWLPETCAYRLISEGKTLPDWHHLISGRFATVHQAGQSARGKTVPEMLAEKDLTKHIID